MLLYFFTPRNLLFYQKKKKKNRKNNFSFKILKKILKYETIFIPLNCCKLFIKKQPSNEKKTSLLFKK